MHEDRTVTFRFDAPTAKEIVLVANFLPEPRALQKDDKGIFSVTVGPLDPHNPYGQRGSDDATSSMFEVHASAPAYFDPQPVPHGEVRTIWYGSKSMGTERSFRVYTPLFAPRLESERKRLERSRPRQLLPR